MRGSIFGVVAEPSEKKQKSAFVRRRIFVCMNHEADFLTQKSVIKVGFFVRIGFIKKHIPL
jgi:hypothetical protein